MPGAGYIRGAADGTEENNSDSVEGMAQKITNLPIKIVIIVMAVVFVILLIVAIVLGVQLAKIKKAQQEVIQGSVSIDLDEKPSVLEEDETDINS